jgi:hypothetical protein
MPENCRMIPLPSHCRSSLLPIERLPLITLIHSYMGTSCQQGWQCATQPSLAARLSNSSRSIRFSHHHGNYFPFHHTACPNFPSGSSMALLAISTAQLACASRSSSSESSSGECVTAVSAALHAGNITDRIRCVTLSCTSFAYQLACSAILAYHANNAHHPTEHAGLDDECSASSALLAMQSLQPYHSQVPARQLTHLYISCACVP